MPAGSGTGFVIDVKERLVLTARHVLENTKGGMVSAAVVIFAQSQDGEIITDAGHYQRNRHMLAVRGNVIFESVRRDMAVVQVEKLPAGIKPLPLASRNARPGQRIHIVGNSTENFGAVFSYSQGYVRNVFRWEHMGATVVATQAPTNKGDSGGPMVNDRGEVVGLVAMSTTGGQLPKTTPFHDIQVTELSICVGELRDALKEMRQRLLAKHDKPGAADADVKGQAKSGHFVMMEKDILYRILVNAEGFIPDVRVDNTLLNPVTTMPRGLGEEAQFLYTPKETKVYRILIGPLPGRDIAKGGCRYTFTVDQATFAPESSFKDTQLKLNEHVRKFEAGKAYDISVKGRGFEPDVQIVDGSKTVMTRFNNGARSNSGTAQKLLEAVGLANSEFETRLVFVAARTAEYRILVAVSPFSPQPKGALDYSIQVAEQKLELLVKDQLTAKDPLYPQAGPFKIHTVQLEAGTNYQIDLMTTAFDSRLVLEDSARTQLMQGFDAEGFNSRLFIRPTKTAGYRVVAAARQIDATGPYTLTVAQSPNPPSTPPGLPGFDKSSSRIRSDVMAGGVFAVPFTPFHLGPATVVKAVAGRSFSLTVFGFSQVAMDVEVLVRLLLGEGIVHGFSHTYLGGTLIAVFSLLVGRPLCQLLLNFWTPQPRQRYLYWLRGRQVIAWPAASAAAFLGTYSHVLLDSMAHGDVQPFAPFAEGNPLRGLISLGAMHVVCVGTGILGLLGLAIVYLVESR